MKENNEWERRDLAIDSEMEVDCDIGQEITVYVRFERISARSYLKS